MPPPLTQALSRDQVNALNGAVMLEFGADWCGYCQAAQAMIAAQMASFPSVSHLKIEDGKGKKLGRSFNVKLWPTLIFMKDGIELTRLIRPVDSEALRLSLQLITTQDA